MNKIKFPEKIKVAVIRNKKTGVYIAELLDYDLHTEADNFYDLVSNVNDLLLLYLNVPKRLLGNIIYTPPLPQKKSIENISSEKNISMDFLKYYLLPNNGCCLNG